MLVSDGSDGEDEKGNEIKNKNKRNAFQVKCGYTALPMELIKVERITFLKMAKISIKVKFYYFLNT